MSSNVARTDAVRKKVKEYFGRVVQAAERGIVQGLLEFEHQNIIRKQLSGQRGGSYGLNRFTGQGASSWAIRKTREGKDFVAFLGLYGKAWYLKAHQHFKFDGYIRPKNAGALAVPIDRSARGRRPSDIPDLQFNKRPGKPPLLAMVQERKMRPMFVLKKSVYLPKRLYITEEFRTDGRRMIREAVNREVKKIK